MWKFSSALRQKSHLHYTTDEERQLIKQRFKNEGLNELMPDDKKLPHVWRWLTDAETNWMSMKKQNEKLHKQQEADLKEVEEYIEKLWKQSKSRLIELQTENDLLKDEIYKLKLSKPTDTVLDIVNNNRKGLNKNMNDIDLHQNDDIKENKKLTFNNVKQIFIKSTDKDLQLKKQDQSLINLKQLNLENELRVLIDKCRQIENEKKRLEMENENLLFKLNETLEICDQYESNEVNVQIARNSKTYKELKHATSEYQMNKISNDKSKFNISKTMFFNKNKKENDIKNDDNKLLVNKNNNFIVKETLINNEIARNLNETELSKQNNSNNLNIDSGIECSSTLTDSRESCQEVDNALRLMHSIKDECANLKKELLAKEKQLSDLQLKYDKRKARHKDQMLKLKDHIEKETKKWEKLFQNTKKIDNEKNRIKQKI